MKSILIILGFLGLLYVGIYVLSAVFTLGKWIIKKDKDELMLLNPFFFLDNCFKTSTRRYIALMLLTLGLGYLIMSKALASEQIGDYFEKGNYDCDYLAILRFEDRTEIGKVSVTKDDGDYMIWTVETESGYYQDCVDTEYFPERIDNYFYYGEEANKCYIELVKPME